MWEVNKLVMTQISHYGVNRFKLFTCSRLTHLVSIRTNDDVQNVIITQMRYASPGIQ